MDSGRLLIKEYTHWKIYLHENQCYLGRAILWAKRSDALDFFDMTKEERDQYFEVGQALKKALKALFSPDLYNYATLANVDPHLHTHVIPRYASSRKFLDLEFKDNRWGQNYAPYDKDFKLTEKQLEAICGAIAKAIT